jgi:hypothetical protein
VPDARSGDWEAGFWALKSGIKTKPRARFAFDFDFDFGFDFDF